MNLSHDPLHTTKQIFSFLMGRIEGEVQSDEFEQAIDALAGLGPGADLKPEIRAEFLTLKMCALIRATSREFTSRLEARGQSPASASSFGRGLEDAMVMLFDQRITSIFPSPRFPEKWPPMNTVSLTYFEGAPLGVSPDENDVDPEPPRNQFSFILQTTLKSGLVEFLHQDMQVAELVVEAALSGKLRSGGVLTSRGLYKGDGTFMDTPKKGSGCAILALGPLAVLVLQIIA